MAKTRRKTSPPPQRALPIEEPQIATIRTMPVATPAPVEREPKLPLERIGDVLKRERNRRGDDLQQIAEYLCIRRSFLEAIENSRYDQFPADAYVIGFLRSYAEYLGLNGKETIDYYRHEMAGRRKKPILSMPTPISEGRAPSAIILAGAAIAALLVYAIWYGISAADRASISQPVSPNMTVNSASSDIPHASDTAQPALVNEPAVTANTAAVAPALPVQAVTAQPPAAYVQASPSTQAQPLGGTVIPAQPVSRVTITAEQASWVLITDGKGHTVFDRVMKAGEVYHVPDAKGLMLTTGNGAGVMINVDGVNMPHLSAMQSKIIRNIPLDPSTLRNNVSRIDE